MGGVSIWSMHYIGNRAIVLYGGLNGLQLSYGAGYTVLSLFMPILVLLLACLVVGSSEKPTLWRFTFAGTFGSAAICGMHYLVDRLLSSLSFRVNYPSSTIPVRIILVMSWDQSSSHLSRQTPPWLFSSISKPSGMMLSGNKSSAHLYSLVLFLGCTGLQLQGPHTLSYPMKKERRPAIGPSLWSLLLYTLFIRDLS
jgi:hypothetical protein